MFVSDRFLVLRGPLLARGTMREVCSHDGFDFARRKTLQAHCSTNDGRFRRRVWDIVSSVTSSTVEEGALAIGHSSIPRDCGTRVRAWRVVFVGRVDGVIGDPFRDIGWATVDPAVLIVFEDPVLEVRPWLCGEEDVTAYRARVAGGALGIHPRGDASRADRVLAREADLPLDDTGLGAKGAAFCEADDATFAAGGLYAVLDSKQLSEECLCHCGGVSSSVVDWDRYL